MHEAVTPRPVPRNVRLVLEYDGAAFAGWQLQKGRRTVEGELRRALAELGQPDIAVIAAGRTDAGAHAEGQVVNFHYRGRLTPSRLLPALNARLPSDTAVLTAEEVPDAFHARYSARWRQYRYRYFDRPVRPALDRARCWHVRRPLDVEAMAAAARALVGRHDWTTFCAASEPAESRVRAMRTASVERCGRFVELDLVGEGFLRGLVRGIAGALLEVGLQKRSPTWLHDILIERNRSLAAPTAPPAGLTLVAVEY